MNLVKINFRVNVIFLSVSLLLVVLVAAGDSKECGKYKNVTRTEIVLKPKHSLEKSTGDCEFLNIPGCQHYKKNLEEHNVTQVVKLDCCPGYQYSKFENECSPVCDVTCMNGDCTEPNVCTCREGFIKSTQFECIPDCHNRCTQKQRCIEPDFCECTEGYKSNNQGGCTEETDLLSTTSYSISTFSTGNNSILDVNTPESTTATEDDSAAASSDHTIECDNCYAFSDNQNEKNAEQSSMYLWLVLLLLVAIIVFVTSSLAYLSWTRRQTGEYYVSTKEGFPIISNECHSEDSNSKETFI